MVKGVIFDLDGTLIDSMQVWYDVDRRFLGENGIDDPPEDISDRVKKMTVDQSSELFIREFGLSCSKEYVIRRIEELVRLEYEENIMLTLHAKQVSNAKLITKINRSTFKNVISKLDLGSVIYPRYITSEAIIAYVRAKKNSTNSNIETLYHMFDNRAEAIEFCVDEPSSVTGIPLKDLMLKNDLLVSFIYRNGKVQIPSGLDTIEVGDTVMIVTTHTGLDNIQDIIRS